jgi:hypothetical protein
MSKYYDESLGCFNPDTTLSDKIRSLVRTGEIGSTGTARIPSWTKPETILISVKCTSKSETAGDVSGIYNGMTYAGAAVGAPVVTVTANVPYRSLFGLPFGSTFGLTASQQSAVVGY